MEKLTTEEFIKKSKTVHGDKYDYSKVNYVNATTKVCIICPEHGEFWQLPNNHMKGVGCPSCSGNKRMTTEDFKKRLKTLYPNTNILLDKVVYKNNHTNVTLICPEHGEFERWPTSLLEKMECPECQKIRLHNMFAKKTDVAISDFRKIHGDKYDYSKTFYNKTNEKITIICPEHGEFEQLPLDHLRGQGCPTCGSISMWDKRGRMTTESWKEKAINIHGDKYDYSESEYTGAHDKIKIICKKHGEFWQDAYAHLNGQGCNECGHEITHSSNEIELFEYIKSLLPNEEIKIGDRKIIHPMEIDVYIPSKKLAFEFDGLYWHSENKISDSKYHLKKTVLCNNKGIRLIHIFEDEWILKKDIVKSRIKSILGISDNKISASKCKIKEISSKIANEFIEENHIQGSCQSKYQYGLFYKDELVSVMTFGHLRKNLNGRGGKNDYELLRFCNKLNTNVVGGASKLLSHFIRDYSPETILSYSDKRWNTGNVYKQLGFKWSHDSSPSYFYVVSNRRENRYKYRKSELVKEGYSKELSEHDIMLRRGIYRIYDCGCKVYKLTIKQ